MTPDERERMHILCQRIAGEQDHGNFLRFVRQLNELLERKNQRFAENTAPIIRHRRERVES
jgi:hypothetical protein